jgi:hypothetical protein
MHDIIVIHPNIIALHCSFLGDASITASTVIPGNSPGVTDPVKQSDAGLIAGATIVATIFMLIVALVIYMCCCRCKQKDYPRKNSTYQMYSEVDASQMVVRYLCKQTLENTEGAIKKGQS